MGRKYLQHLRKDHSFFPLPGKLTAQSLSAERRTNIGTVIGSFRLGVKDWDL